MGTPARHLDRQRATFTSLASRGVYRSGDVPPACLVGFFKEVLGSVLDTKQNPICVLDCGCGTGAWLKLLDRTYGDSVKLYGFDATPDMVALAADTLSGSALVQVGDLLDGSAYGFEDGRNDFHVIYAYDVVQQLPRKRQFRAVQMMLEHIVADGSLVVFDHDRDTRYGRKMGLKKLLTRYAFLQLVPRYYCNAAYPPLSRFCERLTELGCRAEMRIGHTGEKRALIVTA